MRSPFSFAIVLALIVHSSAVSGALPWNVPFSEDVRGVREAAKAVQRGDHPDVIVLLSEHESTIHSDGRVETVVRKVYLIVQQEAVDDWSQVEQQYQPWYQEKPELKARVITNDGAVHWLDPKTIADSPTRQFDSTIFSDARLIRAPLPAAAAGSTVEYQVTIRDRIPMLNAGTTHRIAVDQLVPFERFHAVVRAEPGITLRAASRLIPESAIRRETDRGGSRIEVDFGPQDPAKDFEWDLPFDESNVPYLTFSTGASWQSVAAAYASIVVAKIAEGTAVPRDPAGGTPLEIAARLAARLHKAVRYTGVEFAEAAIVPNPPSETLRRGYGDCKDKATTLVAMLRAAGLHADLALLSAGTGPDIDPETPGLGQFDHAIVYVGTQPPLWIDATAAGVRTGMLPVGDQGRLALIASSKTKELIKTPESSIEENRTLTTVEIKMSDLGPGEIAASLEIGGGWYESQARDAYGGDEKRAKEALETLAKSIFRAKALGEYKAMPKDDLSGPYRLSIRASKCQVANTGPDDGGVALSPAAVFEFVPYGLKNANSFSQEESRAKPRRHDFVLQYPFRSEYRYRILPPPGYRIGAKPESSEVKLGPAIFARSYTVAPDQTVEVVFRLEMPKRRWTSAEVEAFRAGLKKLDVPASEFLTFLPETAEFVAAGQIGKAVALLRDRVKREPENAMAHARFSQMLLTAGLGGVALEEAREAVRLDPNSTAAWVQLALAYQHDTFGRPAKGNWNFAEAEKCLRKAVELEPAEIVAKATLAVLLEYNAHGVHYAKDSRMDEALSLYRDLTEKAPNPQLYHAMVLILLRSRKLDDVKAIVPKTPAQIQPVLPPLLLAMQEGLVRGIASATAGMTDVRQREIALGSLGVFSTMLREYPLAQGFFRAAGRTGGMGDLSSRAELMGKVKRHEESLLPETDPAWPLQHLILQTLRREPLGETMKALLARGYTSGTESRAMPVIANALAGIQHDLWNQVMDDQALIDYVASLTSFEKKGDDKRGYTVKALLPGWGQIPPVYVVNEDGHYRIIGIAPDSLDAVGELALRLLDKGDVSGAQFWLDRVVSDLEPRPDGTGLPAVRGLWSGITRENRGPAAVRLAAKQIVASARSEPDAAAAVVADRLKETTAVARDQHDKALCEIWARAGKWAELAAVAQRLMSSKLFAEEGFRYLLKSATGSGDWTTLEAEARKRYQANPTNLYSAAIVALARAQRRDWAGAADWTGKVLASKENPSVAELAVLARVSAESGKPDSKLLELLKNLGIHDAQAAFARAELEAAMHQPDEAMVTLRKELDEHDYDWLPAAAWKAYARICLEYGFSDEAERARTRAREIGQHDGEYLNGTSVRVMKVNARMNLSDFIGYLDDPTVEP